MVSTALAQMRTLLHWIRPREPVGFLMLVVVCLVTSRLFLIQKTLHQNVNIDLSIYREIGQLVLSGIDPYDFSTNRDMREQLRTDGAGASAWVSETQERYDYYVSSNPPGSTLLYAAFEFVSRGNPYLWRLCFLLGDVTIALAACYLLRSARVSFDSAGTRLAYASIVVAYPSLLLWGTVIPEDKQFQLALMLLFAALLVRPIAYKPSLGRACAMGAIGALSIVFKALGGILLPLMASFLAKRERLEILGAVLAFLAVALLICLPFSDSFVELIAKRAQASSLASVPIHSSPWILFASTAQAFYPKLAIALSAGLCCLWAYLRKRIDLLNVLAGLLLIYICIWITNGSMDRMNIAMIFALMCIATISVETWQRLVLANTAVQIAVYGIGLGFLGAPNETCDAISCLFFLMTYFFAIVRLSVERNSTFVNTTPSQPR